MPLTLQPSPAKCTFPPRFCTSCDEWCNTTCSWAPPNGSVAVHNGTAQQMIVYRMTPRNLTDLLNKDTGDASGDVAFTLMELAMPMKCRHEPTNSDCKSTHGWLMDSDLVYAEHRIEAAVWGPYQACNIRPGHPNEPFSCDGARTQSTMKDLEMCESCKRTSDHAGWYPLSQMAKGWTPATPPSKQCVQLAEQECGAFAAVGKRGECELCVNNHQNLSNKTGGCDAAALKLDWCPPYIPPNKTCEIEATKLCGSYEHRVEERDACEACAKANAAELYAAGCPSDFKPLYNYSLQICEKPTKPVDPYAANIMLMSKVAGGIWLSTPTKTKCADNAAPFADQGNCTWKDLGLQKIKNFTCINSGLNRAVMSKNASCWSRCPDGKQVYPVAASDCWLDCYYQVVSGGTQGQDGLPTITQQEMVDAWSLGFKTTDPAKGGCPSLDPPKAIPRAEV